MEWQKSNEKPTLSSHLDTAFKGLAKSLRLYPRCFLDARELAPEGPSAAEQVFTRAAGAGIPFIPVTGISNRADTSAALSNRERGLAIRLTRAEFEAGDLSYSLPAFMARHGIGFEDTDLIVDLGPVDDMVTEGVTRFAHSSSGMSRTPIDGEHSPFRPQRFRRAWGWSSGTPTPRLHVPSGSPGSISATAASSFEFPRIATAQSSIPQESRDSIRE